MAQPPGDVVEGVVEAAALSLCRRSAGPSRWCWCCCRKRRGRRSSYAGLVAPDMAGTTERGPLQEERSDHSWRGVGQDWQLQGPVD